MKLTRTIALLFVTVFFCLFLFPLKQVFSADCQMLNPADGTVNTLNSNDSEVTVQITQAYQTPLTFNDIKQVDIWCTLTSGTSYFPQPNNDVKDLGSGNIEVHFKNQGTQLNGKCWSADNQRLSVVKIYVVGTSGNSICAIPNIIVTNTTPPGQSCVITNMQPNPPTPGKTYTITIGNLSDKGPFQIWKNIKGDVFWNGVADNIIPDSEGNAKDITLPAENIDTNMTLSIGGWLNGTYFDQYHPICSTPYFIIGKVGIPTPSTGKMGLTDICSFIKDSQKATDCVTCFKMEGVFTPFGCIQSNPQKFVEAILRIAIGIAGGIAFLMIVYGGFVVMTSAGNPEHLTNGKEIITSAIAGLLLIIFSVVILRIIGVDILQIPGLIK